MSSKSSHYSTKHLWFFLAVHMLTLDSELPRLSTWFSAELCEHGYTSHQPRTSGLRSLGCQTPSSTTGQRLDSRRHLAKIKKIEGNKEKNNPKCSVTWCWWCGMIPWNCINDMFYSPVTFSIFHGKYLATLILRECQYILLLKSPNYSYKLCLLTLHYTL